MLRQRSAAARINHDGVNYSDRFIMRPSIARMTLDLDYGADLGGMDHKRATEALTHRLAELLVFEIRQDGDTQFQTLSVRGLYKYVLKSIRFSGVNTKQPRSNPKLLTNSHAEYLNQRKQEKANRKQRQKKRELETKGGGNHGSDSSSSSSSSGDEAEERHRDLLGQRKSSSGSKQSASTATRGVEGKSVTFGGSQGPIVIEHPPKQDTNNAPKQQPESNNVNLPEDDLTEDQDSVHSKERHHHHHHPHEVTYRERLGAFLHPRDLRRLTTPFSATNEPELIVRRHVMLLNFDPLRAVVLRDRLLVLVPDGADSLLVDLEKRVRGGSREVERSIFGEAAHTVSQAESNIGDSQHSVSVASIGTDNGRSSQKKRKHATAILKKVAGAMAHHEPKETMTDKTTSNVSSDNDSTAPGSHFADSASEFQEWDEMESRDWIDLPFELQCLDAVLGSVCTILGKDTGELQSTSLRAMDRLLHQGSNQGEEILRHMKNSVKEMTGRVKGFIRAMNLVLDETEDMALMNLSRLLTHPDRFIQPVPEEILNEESDEPELILEAHLQQAFSLTNSLDLVRGEIETTQELINQRLDAVRNRLLLANMIISVGSFCVALGSFIGSIFGMNVINHIEEDPNAFKHIVIGTCFSMVGLVFLVGVGLWYAGTLPNLRSSL